MEHSRAADCCFTHIFRCHQFIYLSYTTPPFMNKQTNKQYGYVVENCVIVIAILMFLFKQVWVRMIFPHLLHILSSFQVQRQAGTREHAALPSVCWCRTTLLMHLHLSLAEIERKREREKMLFCVCVPIIHLCLPDSSRCSKIPMQSFCCPFLFLCRSMKSIWLHFRLACIG